MKQRTTGTFTVPLNPKGFGGIDSSRPQERISAAESVNFRLLGNGTLRKRCGYRRVLRLSDAPRAVYEGYHEGEAAWFFLIGSRVIRYTVGRDVAEEIGEVASAAGKGAFTLYRGVLYLFDGSELYFYTGDRFARAEGYLPLYAKDWDPRERGAVCERPNLLTNRVRLRYKNTLAWRDVTFGRAVRSIERVLCDGGELALTEVTLAEDGLSCRSERFASAFEIELAVTLASESRREEISRAKHAYLYGNADDSRLLVCGGSVSSSLYGSEPVSAADAAASDVFGRTNGGMLYFPEGRELSHFGAPITAVTRFFDRILLFTPSGAWVTELSDGGALRMTEVHDSVGCDRYGGAVTCGGYPFSVFGGRLWRWSAKATARNECTAEIVSDGFAEALSEALSGEISMEYYGGMDELWIRPVGDAVGRVLIFHTRGGYAYTFEGVHADRLLPSAADGVFLSENELCIFDESCDTDGDTEDGIRAFYRSEESDLGDFAAKKHLVRYFLEGIPDGTVTLRFYGDGRRVFAADLTGTDERSPEGYCGRASVGRFHRLAFSFEACGRGRPTVESLCVTARK